MAERHHPLRRLAVLAGPLLLAGCGALPEPGPVERPVEDVPVTAAEYRRQIMRPATDSLLVQSREQAADGRPDLAAATLERALRIDPEEPALWLELGKLAYEGLGGRRAIRATRAVPRSERARRREPGDGTRRRRA